MTGAKDDFEALLELHLPEGVSAVGGSKVLVQVSIAAIESSMAISLPVEITGLSPIYEVQLAPAIVDVLLSGPVPVLNGLKPSDIRVKVDLTSYGVGVHQIMPVVDFLPAGVRKESILPATLEVTISLAPTQTPTITPSPSVTITPTSTLTPTPLGP